VENLKYSRQREAIKNYLSSTKEHPTANTVYLHIKEEFPNISLGTVYRNLNLLASIGDAIKISTPDGGDRFDGRTAPHYHVVCTCCGNMYDLELDHSHVQMINDMANDYYDGIIESHETIFYGTCPDCIKKTKSS
jgi:Fur family peroxide stress response transcriptional regulator